MKNYVRLDADVLSEKFPDQPFSLRHELVGHPLLTLESLVGLANDIDRDHVEYNSGKVKPGQKFEDMPKMKLGISQTIKTIEECGAWMVIKNIETVPAYCDLVNSCLKDAAAQAQRSGETMSDFQGFIFISSADTVTPFHVDGEENFLLQVKGQKFIHIFDNDDRSLVSDGDMEISPANHRNKHYRPDFEDRAQVFQLDPGNGVFVPHLMPHWVRTGDDYCISIAITWKTPKVLSHNKLLAANGLFRKIGCPQSAPGKRPVWDGVKIAAYGVARAMVEPLRKSEWMRKLLRRLLFGRTANYYYET